LTKTIEVKSKLIWLSRNYTW